MLHASATYGRIDLMRSMSSLLPVSDLKWHVWPAISGMPFNRQNFGGDSA